MHDALSMHVVHSQAYLQQAASACEGMQWVSCSSARGLQAAPHLCPAVLDTDSFTYHSAVQESCKQPTQHPSALTPEQT